MNRFLGSRGGGSSKEPPLSLEDKQMDENVKVILRFRPMNKLEMCSQSANCATVHEDGKSVTLAACSDSEYSCRFVFDKVFDQRSTQESVYAHSSQNLVPEFLSGRNCCIIAYGQTESGKTYTMMGYPYEGNDAGDDVSSLSSCGVSEVRVHHHAMAPAMSGPPTQVSVPFTRQPTKYSRRKSLDARDKHYFQGSSRSLELGNLDENSPFDPGGGVSAGGGKEDRPDWKLDEHGYVISEERNAYQMMDVESGMITRLIHDIFEAIRQSSSCKQKQIGYMLWFSFVDVCQETVLDMLDTYNTKNSNLEIKEDTENGGGIFIEGVTEVRCNQKAEVLSLIQKGVDNRVSQLTRMGMGTHSSRSHSIFTVKMEQHNFTNGQKKRATLRLVDLAGTDVRSIVAQSSVESQKMNKALTSLSNIVRILSSEKEFNHSKEYRESKLTHLLKDAIGGNCKTSVIITASPSSMNLGQTMSSIRFGNMTKKIRNVSRVNLEMVSDEQHGNDNPNKNCTPKEQDQHAMNMMKRMSGDLKGLHSGGWNTINRIEEEDEEEDKSSAGQSRKSNTSLSDDTSIAKNNDQLVSLSSLLRSANKRIESKKDDIPPTLEILEEDVAADHITRNLFSRMESEMSGMMGVARESKTTKQPDTYSSQQQSNRDTSSAKPTLFASNQIDSDLRFVLEDLSVGSGGSEHDNQLSALIKLLEEKDQDFKTAKHCSLLLQMENMSLKNELRDRNAELAAYRKTTNKISISENNPVQTSASGLNTPPFLESGDNLVTEEGNLLLNHDNNDTSGGNVDGVRSVPIQVCLRLRPLSKVEIGRRACKSCMTIQEGSRRDFFVDSPMDGQYEFNYHRVFDASASQSQVYEYLKRSASIPSKLLGGMNCCLMAYGLTGSGKTHTIMGNPNLSLHKNPKLKHTQQQPDTGILPRLIADLFQSIERSPSNTEFTIKCSYISIYLEQIHDVLAPLSHNNNNTFENPDPGTPLFCKSTLKGIEIEGATEAYCFTESEVLTVLQSGRHCQSVLFDRMNVNPNQTHSLFLLKLEQKVDCIEVPSTATGTTLYSQLLVADLAGYATKSKGQTSQETKILQKPQAALEKITKMLDQKGSAINEKNLLPYRDSKLTSVLLDALGGNCQTTVIVTASPSSLHISETLGVVRFGQRLTRLVNLVRVNADYSVGWYKRWQMMSEVKLGELIAFVKELASELVHEWQEEAKTGKGGGSCPKFLSNPLWDSINAIVEEEEQSSNRCKKHLNLGNAEELHHCGAKWKVLSSELSKRVPAEELSSIADARNRAESMLFHKQSELVGLRWLNESLSKEKRTRQDEFLAAKKELKIITLEKTEVVHKLGMSEVRTKDAMMFIRYLRILCWKLQNYLVKSDKFSDVMNSISGTPDFGGLIDLDLMLQEANLINVECEDEFDFEEELLSLHKHNTRGGSAYKRMSSGPSSMSRLDESTNFFNDQSSTDTGASTNDFKASSARLNQNQRRHGGLISYVSNRWLEKPQQKPPTNVKIDENEDDLTTSFNIPTRIHSSSAEHRQLEQDFRVLTRKYLDLQITLEEERAVAEMGATNAINGIGRGRRLALEVAELKKDRDKLLNDSKTIAWKVQELQAVNKILHSKIEESQEQVTLLEVCFSGLQNTFRATVLKSLDKDAQLREQVSRLETLYDSLTGPNESIIVPMTSSDDPNKSTKEFTLPRVNVALRGTNSGQIPQNHQMSSNDVTTSMHITNLKKSDCVPCSRIKRKSKYLHRYHERCSSMGSIAPLFSILHHQSCIVPGDKKVLRRRRLCIQKKYN